MLLYSTSIHRQSAWAIRVGWFFKLKMNILHVVPKSSLKIQNQRRVMFKKPFKKIFPFVASKLNQKDKFWIIIFSSVWICTIFHILKTFLYWRSLWFIVIGNLQMPFWATILTFVFILLDLIKSAPLAEFQKLHNMFKIAPPYSSVYIHINLQYIITKIGEKKNKFLYFQKKETTFCCAQNLNNL